MDNLTFWSHLAHIAAFFISLGTLLYVRSVKVNIVRFRRRNRLRTLLEDIERVPDDAVPLAEATRVKLLALQRNIPVHFYSRWTEEGQAARTLRQCIDQGQIAEIREAIQDWKSYSEDA